MSAITRIAASVVVLLLLLPAILMREEHTGAALAQSQRSARAKPPASQKPTARSKAQRSRASSARKRNVARRSARASARRSPTRRLVLRPGGLIPRERVREIQLALIERGFLEGPPTGVYDARTVEAMKRFQEAEGIEVTGYPTAHALYRLGLHPAASSNGATAAPVHRSPPSS